MVDLSGLRVAFYTDDGFTSTTPETAGAVQSAAEALMEICPQVTEARPDRIGSDAFDISRRYWERDELPGEDIRGLLKDWDDFRTRMLSFMEAIDLIVCPTCPRPANLHGHGTGEMFNYTLPFSLTGQPCVVVPSGRSREGLPIGVQIVGRVWKEDVAIAAARYIERLLGGWQAPPS